MKIYLALMMLKFDYSYSIQILKLTPHVLGHFSMLALLSFKPSGTPNAYQLNRSISALRVIWWYFSFLFKVYGTTKET